MHKKILAVLLAMLMGITMLTGCAGNNKTDAKKFGSLEDFTGETIAILSGGALDAPIQKNIGDTQISWVKDYGAAIEAVKTNKAAAVAMDKPVAYKAAAVNTELKPFPIAVEIDDYGYIFPKGSELVEKVNSALRQLKDSGKTKELEDYWINNPVSDPVVEPQKSTGANGTVKIAVDVSFEPMSYMNGEGEVIGYDIALCNQIFDLLDIKAEYIVVSFDTIVETVTTGKADLAAGPISITDERKKSVDFCDVTYAGEVTLLVREDRVAPELLNGSDAAAPTRTIEDALNEAEIGLMTGSKAIPAVEKLFPNATVLEYDELSSSVEALKAGKIDYVITSRSTAVNFAKNNKDTLCVIDTNILGAADTSAYAPVKKGDERLAQYNEVLTRFIEDGTMDKIINNWVSDNAANDTTSIPRLGEDAPVLKVGVAANREPTSFIRGENEIVGLDPELAERMAYELGMRVEFTDMSFSALLPALESGKVDIVFANMGASEERRQVVDFTVPYFDNPNIVLAKKTEENLTFAAAVNTEQTVEGDEDLDQKLQTANFGVMQGTTAATYLAETYPNSEVLEFDSIDDAVEALKANKVDFVMTPYSTAKNFENKNDVLYVPDKVMMAENVSIAVKKGNTELLDTLNDLLAQYKSDGTMDKILANWFGSNGEKPGYSMSDVPKLGDDAPVLTIGVAANREPMCFIADDVFSGLDSELIERMAYDMGMRVEYMDMSFSGLIPALESGRVDVVISNVSATEERRQVVDFTEPYFDNPQVLIMRKADVMVAATDETEITKSGWESFWSGLKDSFTRTFITENRWKLVLNGLGVTILISLCAFVIGSLWGGVICALLRSKRKIANIPAKVYVRLLQGTPIVVLLMILYYIVFKDFDISAIIVAIIGFALNLGAYTSQIFKTAIDSVDKGQIEAASAMGFNKFRVFIKIIFPQAARNALPVYKGEFISLVKSTSIVGYIAIQDLTKVSDIIRSRTYEAFFPLIATAIIYFVVTYIFIVLLNVLEKKIDPKRRKRIVKGVEVK